MTQGIVTLILTTPKITTLSIIKTSTRTLVIMTLRIATLRMIAPSITTLSIMDKIATLSNEESQYKTLSIRSRVIRGVSLGWESWRQIIVNFPVSEF